MLSFNQLLASTGIAAATELTVASLANPTELNAVGTAVPDWRLCHQTTTGSDQATLYRLDATTDAANAPGIVASATAGLKWVAVAGAYVYGGTTETIGPSATVNVTATTGPATLSLNSPAGQPCTLSMFQSGTGSLYTLTGGSATLTLGDAQAGVSPLIYNQGSLAASSFLFQGTKSATTSLLGALVVGNGTAATSIGMGAGNINAGGNLTVGGVAIIAPAIAASNTSLTVTVPANTSQTAATEVFAGLFDSSATINWATGNFASERFWCFKRPVVTATAATTITTAATVAINGAPSASTNMTITNPRALWIQGGSSEFDGDILQSAPTTGIVATGSTNWSLRTDTNMFLDFDALNVAGKTLSMRCSGETVTLATFTSGALSAATVQLFGTLSASSSTAGAVVIGNGTAATSVAIGGGIINVGTGVGIGATPTTTNPINISVAVGGAEACQVSNSNPGTSSYAAWNASNGTNMVQLIQFGTGFTTAGVETSTSAGVKTNNSLTLILEASGGSGSIAFATGGNTSRGGISSAGVWSMTVGTDATTDATGTVVVTGGVGISKNLVAGQGLGWGVTSNATVNGTITLTTASKTVQTFTGSTVGTIIQFQAANAFGAGVGVRQTINNQSSVAVTPTRAGADTFQGGGTTDTVNAGVSQDYISDGVSVWLKI